ncbi:hypothetical protein BDY19DRAFT_991758 [Irpex rosettiformis]|uniref:Uncharacterized protein n=1 Tax=Irpex rosettiformis TaxID=378272 RepID=A0ACB8UAB7_9APHY|nr:hypothetical protein BDY19DRAFT_991758 [Irpex rosettiformis]
MSCELYPAKFDSLHLSKLWEAVVGRIDFRLSDPSSSSYDTESAATWRALDPSMQRSYMVVAIKNTERDAYKNAPLQQLSASQAYERLLRAIHELLWATSTVMAGEPPMRPYGTTGYAPFRSVLGRVGGNLDASTTATILPMSAVWNSLNRKSIPPSHTSFSSAHRSGRKPASPLSRHVTISWEEYDDEDVDSAVDPSNIATLEIVLGRDPSSDGSSDV